MVVLSLLALSFPLAAFADTSESIPAETVGSRQEQVIESSSVPEETGVDNELSTVPTETQTSSEGKVETQETDTEDATANLEITKKENLNEAPTTETSNVETKATENAKTSDSVQNRQTVVKALESPAVVEENLNKEWTAEKIRENLTGTDYGINQNELKGYTDEELTNAFKLFNRYNFDITGMDLGSYVRVLRMVYKEKVVSWNDVEKALAFNPNNYTTTAELAKNVDQLQAYLRVLYANKDGFLPLRQFSNEEMLHILDHLSGAEDELSAANGLFSGLVHWLYNSQQGNGPIENGPRPIAPIQNLATTTKPIAQDIATFPNTTTTMKNDITGQTAGQKEYPKTGERGTTSLTIIGIAVFLFTGLVVLKRRAYLK
ncbi:LPXTG cell wall anchor domain-containing protein [Enterococcus sp. DIV0756]|uniref:LPXTG cell wall anchor domain-containing protein n=1 Tax=Enterococcus sp. DIV0756 TaxID=2774636 RepID=UPI003F683C99